MLCLLCLWIHKDKKNKNILVFYLGCNEINVSILNVQDSLFEIKGTVRNIISHNLTEESFEAVTIK